MTLLVAATLPAALPAAAWAQGGTGAPRGAGDARGTFWAVRWGPQRPDLIRYNRVEGLSLGTRVDAGPWLFGRPIFGALTLRLGSADRRVNARLDMRQISLRRSFGFAAYSELSEVELDMYAPDPISSLLALLAGRDDGDYYRRTGSELSWDSPPGAHHRLLITIHSEYHEPARSRARFALPRLWDHSWGFRPNSRADEGWEHAVQARWRAAFGDDPRSVQGGMEAAGLAATGMAEFLRGSVTGRLALPVRSDLRLVLEVRGGASAGPVTVQRLWALGGPASVRGYGPRARVGPCFWRARTEIAKRMRFGDVVVFSDGGWAGACPGGGDPATVGENGSARRSGEGHLASLGAGVFLVDGVIRISAAWALDGRSSRVDLWAERGPGR